MNPDFVSIDRRLIYVILNYAVLSEISLWLQQESVLRNFDDGGSRFHSLTGTQNFEPCVRWTAILKPFLAICLYVFNILFHIICECMFWACSQEGGGGEPLHMYIYKYIF